MLKGGRREFHVAILKGEDDYYRGNVIELSGVGARARTLRELDKIVRETIPLWLEAESHYTLPELINVRKVRIHLPTPPPPIQAGETKKPRHVGREFHVAVLRGEAGYFLAHVVELSSNARYQSLSELTKRVTKYISILLETPESQMHIPKFIALKKVWIQIPKHLLGLTIEWYPSHRDTLRGSP